MFAGSQYADREARDAALADWLAERGARLVVLAGYMELLSASFLARFPRAVINVHPSLLPAFPGLGAIEQALAYGVKVFGVTIHFVDEGCGTPDSGDSVDSRWLFEWQTFFHLGDSIFGGTSGPWFFDKFNPGVRPTVGTRQFHLVVGARSLDETWTVVHTPTF